MHLHFEKNSNTKCDCTILSLSWMGKVPEDIPEEEGWKLNRTNYYQEGWLATGNTRGIVGVTFSTSHCKKNVEYPQRTNYNLRGHRSDVILVKWNEPYQKLASCDSSGIIFVWIKYEGRWSVELINDRNTPVTHFSWSHDGRMALITYQDGFVLVGSVAGQRYWSSMLNLDATITCGLWTPDDQQVYFGTTQGQIIVMDVHGAMVSQVQLSSEFGITSMAWSCEKFKMEEGDTEPGVKNAANRSFVLAVSFQNGSIYLLKSFDDLSPLYINTGLCEGFCMEWSNSRELLAVAGTENDGKFFKKETMGTHFNNSLKFYTESGQILYTAKIPNTNSPVTALTWGHNDRRIFIATGNQVHIAWVSRRVASLQLICRLKIQQCLSSEALLPKLPLPARMKSLIGNLFAQTIRCCVPNNKHNIRDFVSRPPACSTRLHCTMIRHDDDNQSSGTCYTLYLEFMGGLVPLLKGKRTSKIRPEFVIFDPQGEEVTNSISASSSDSTTTKSLSSSCQSTNGSGRNGNTDTSESESDDLCRSPRMQRKRKTRTKKRSTIEKSQNPISDVSEPNADEMAYVDTLPEHMKLVEVTSNIWGTKFKIHGLTKSSLPANLGQVTYKTSLLHLQPRQMTLVITELRDDFPVGPDPNFNPNIFSEDEDECNLKSPKVNKKNRETSSHNNTNGTPSSSSSSASSSHPPIAPMSPRPNRFPSTRNTRRPSPLAINNNNNNSSIPSASSSSTNSSNTAASGSVNPPRSLGPLAKAESYEDDLMETPVAPAKQGISYSNLISSYGRSSSSSSTNQSRVAISPLYCDQSVPTLQSPKNAVAPSDIIFERPPVGGQTTLMSYSSNTDYSNNVVQVKNALINDHTRQTSHVNPVPLNLNLNLERIIDSKSKGAIKKKDIQYIDEEPTPSTSSQTPITQTDIIPSNGTMNRTQTVASICPTIPDIITRSCSVGYLDNFELTPGEVTLSQLRKDAPKRLVLVDRKIQANRKYRRIPTQNRRCIQQLQHNRNFKKSFSLDCCDALQDIPNLHKDLNNLFNQMPKLAESSEDTELSSTELSNTNANALKNKNKCTSTPKKSPKEKFCSFFSSRSGTPILGRKSKNNKDCTCSSASCLKCNNENQQPLTSKPPVIPKWNKKSTTQNDVVGECSKTSRDQKRNKNLEIITSFTDSPLFSRKYRASKNEFGAIPSTSSSVTDNNNNGGAIGRAQLQSEQNTPILSRRSDNRSSSSSDGGQASSSGVECTPVEAKTSVSLHTQAMTTLENIISRLRDLDDDRSNLQQQPPSSPRHPRSSPSSPAPNKKNKRQQSSSPIRHILNSPLLNRRKCKKQTLESSDEDANEDGDNSNNNGTSSNGKSGYHDLETFQKAQLRQKLKRGKIEPNGTSTASTHIVPVRREFVMYNKAPMWNENSQVYQLDFGGRVTQESAKNFQIEFRGKQVMQFGRIDGNAYTLDFQYPFSALQAFSVALANVTQRLK